MFIVKTKYIFIKNYFQSEATAVAYLSQTMSKNMSIFLFENHKFVLQIKGTFIKKKMILIDIFSISLYVMQQVKARIE